MADAAWGGAGRRVLGREEVPQASQQPQKLEMEGVGAQGSGYHQADGLHAGWHVGQRCGRRVPSRIQRLHAALQGQKVGLEAADGAAREGAGPNQGDGVAGPHP